VARSPLWFGAWVHFLPPHDNDAVIILLTLPGATDAMDWSCWGVPEFK
jgi:hypothetical protein